MVYKLCCPLCTVYPGPLKMGPRELVYLQRRFSVYILRIHIDANTQDSGNVEESYLLVPGPMFVL